MNWFGVVGVVYAVAIVVRILRWVAIIQQKEYRVDRLWVYLQSGEGLSDVLRLLPVPADFSRTGLKRPKVTARALISLGLTSGEVLLFSGLGLWWYGTQPTSAFSIIFLCIWFALLHIGIPAWVLVTTLPTSLVARYKTALMSKQAAEVLAAHHPLVIGITGSYGKSSTKQLLAHVLRKKYTVFATPRSFNTRYSVAQSVVAGYQGEEIVILEFGAYAPGEIRRLAADLQPSWAVITGFAPQHVGLFGSEDAIARAKAELLLAIPKTGKAFCNGDDKKVGRIVSAARQQRAISVQEFSVTATPGLRRATLDESGHLVLPSIGAGISTELIGKHYLQTIAGVWSVASELGLSDRMITAQLQNFKPSSNFIQSHVTKLGVLVINDGGTSNPQGFRAALALLAELEYPQKVLITPGIVDLGAQSNGIHRSLAGLAWDAGVSEVLYVGHPGKEQFIEKFGPTRVGTERAVVEAALHSLPAGTVLLIEGRMPGWSEELLKHL